MPFSFHASFLITLSNRLATILRMNVEPRNQLRQLFSWWHFLSSRPLSICSNECSLDFTRLHACRVNTDEEPEEPKLTVLTKQHKNAIRAIRKVCIYSRATLAHKSYIRSSFSFVFFFFPLLTDQVFRRSQEIQRSPQTVRCERRHWTVFCWPRWSTCSNKELTSEVIQSTFVRFTHDFISCTRTSDCFFLSSSFFFFFFIRILLFTTNTQITL